jgi:hypothetical protein
MFLPNARNRLEKSKNSVENVGMYMFAQHKSSTCPEIAHVFSCLQQLHRTQLSLCLSLVHFIFYV